jgi:hypothetical protein
MSQLRKKIEDFKKNGYSIRVNNDTEIFYEYEVTYLDDILWLMNTDNEQYHKFINLSEAKRIDFIPPMKTKTTSP